MSPAAFRSQRIERTTSGCSVASHAWTSPRTFSGAGGRDQPALRYLPDRVVSPTSTSRTTPARRTIRVAAGDSEGLPQGVGTGPGQSSVPLGLACAHASETARRRGALAGRSDLGEPHRSHPGGHGRRSFRRPAIPGRAPAARGRPHGGRVGERVPDLRNANVAPESIEADKEVRRLLDRRDAIRDRATLPSALGHRPIARSSRGGAHRRCPRGRAPQRRRAHGPAASPAPRTSTPSSSTPRPAPCEGRPRRAQVPPLCHVLGRASPDRLPHRDDRLAGAAVAGPRYARTAHDLLVVLSVIYDFVLTLRPGDLDRLRAPWELMPFDELVAAISAADAGGVRLALADAVTNIMLFAPLGASIALGGRISRRAAWSCQRPRSRPRSR